MPAAERHKRPIRQRLSLLGLWAMVGVMALHGAGVFHLWASRAPLPPRISLMELVWAHQQRQVFESLLTLLLVTAGMTLLGWLRKGDHRIGLALSWVTFMLAVMVLEGPRVALFVRIAWAQS